MKRFLLNCRAVNTEVYRIVSVCACLFVDYRSMSNSCICWVRRRLFSIARCTVRSQPLHVNGLVLHLLNVVRGSLGFGCCLHLVDGVQLGEHEAASAARQERPQRGYFQLSERLWRRQFLLPSVALALNSCFIAFGRNESPRGDRTAAAT